MFTWCLAQEQLALFAIGIQVLILSCFVYTLLTHYFLWLELIIFVSTYFWPRFQIYTPLKTPRNLWFSDIFKGFDMGRLTRNGLIWISLSIFLKKSLTALLTFQQFKLTYNNVTFDFPTFFFGFVLFFCELFHKIHVTVHKIHVSLHKKASYHMVTSNS